MKIVVTFAALVIAGSTLAQDYAFKVLINKGQNEVRSGEKEWLPVQVGSSLKSADELKISKNGYVGLVHASGKPLEVKTPGLYRISDLASTLKKGSSLLLQYTDFILSASDEQTNKLTATGSVHRGADRIKMMLPDSKQAVVYNDNISVTWLHDAETPVYIVRLNSMFGDELDQLEVRDTTVHINLKGRKLADEDNIEIEVYAKDNGNRKSESYVIKKLSAADKNRIKTALAALGEVAGEDTALSQLVMGNFYERHSLLIDAATAHLRAIELAPDVPHFREAYKSFLSRNGLLTKE